MSLYRQPSLKAVIAPWSISVWSILSIGVVFQVLSGSCAVAQSQPLFPPVVNNEQNLPTILQENNQNSYFIEIGDVIKLEIFQLPQYSREYRVLVDGTLNLPLVGEVYVEGLTISQAKDEIFSLYSTIIQRPSINIDLISSVPLNIVVSGEVNRPGSYQIPSIAQGERPTLTQAIGLAEGITQNADIKDVRIHRKTSGRTRRDTPESTSVNLWNLIRGGSATEDVLLRNGDSIFVPTAVALTPAELIEMASTSFSPEIIDIYVVGEVPSPGLVQLPPNASLNQAILAAGGFTRRSNTGNVELIRLNPDGSVLREVIATNLADSLASEANPLLLPNDTVVVRPTGFTQLTDTLGVLLPPLNTTFFILNSLFGD